MAPKLPNDLNVEQIPENASGKIRIKLCLEIIKNCR